MMNTQDFEKQLQTRMMMSPDYFPEKFKIENNKDGNSIWVCNMLLYRHKTERDEIILSTANRFISISGLESYILDRRSETNFTYVPFNNQTIKIILENAIDVYTHCFLTEKVELIGCCSKYVQCSDARHCLNTMCELEQGCLYKRLNLDKGRIFYGVNKNN